MTAQTPSPDKKSSNKPVRIGRVVANTGRDILVLMDSSVEVRPVIRMADIVLVKEEGRVGVGTVTGINAPAPGLENEGDEIWIVQVELTGSLGEDDVFLRGGAAAPALGEVVYLATEEEIKRLHANRDEARLPIGHVHDTPKVSATMDPDALTTGGFAILGTADSGKSCTLACIARALLRARYPVNTLIIDPYNEFGHSFGRAGVVMDLRPGLFPHWLLKTEELVWVFEQNGGALDREERSILEEAVPIARRKFLQRSTPGADGMVDGPIPYRVTDLISHIDQASHSDKGRSASAFSRLRERIMVAISDPRFNIIFGTAAATDTLAELMEQLFRVDQSPPLCVLPLGHLSGGLDRIIVSLICRLATALTEWSAVPRKNMLLIDNIERYAPSEVQDDAAHLSRQALRKLGGRPRKLGLSVGFTGAGPRDVDSDLLARCGSVFLHRMPSPLDAEAAEEIMPERTPALLENLASLGQREVVSVGSGMSFSGRITMSELPTVAVPGARPPIMADPSQDDVGTIVNRWRYAGATAVGTKEAV